MMGSLHSKTTLSLLNWHAFQCRLKLGRVYKNLSEKHKGLTFMQGEWSLCRFKLNAFTLGDCRGWIFTD